MSAWALVMILSTQPYSQREIFKYETEQECRASIDLVIEAFGKAIESAIYEPNAEGFHYGPAFNCKAVVTHGSPG